MNIILSGVVGSTAYGLAGPDSDIDTLGIFAAPTIQFHGLHPPVGRAASVVSSNPDCTFHEVGKFAALCLGGNPTVTELLWLDEYQVKTELGDHVIAIRAAFLSKKRVRDAYFGYATSQLKRLLETGEFKSKVRARAAKHGRHLLRLLHQGIELYSTGELRIKVSNPEWYVEQGNLIAENPKHAEKFLRAAEDAFNSTVSPLPEHADEETVEDWLQCVRAAFYKGSYNVVDTALLDEDQR